MVAPEEEAAEATAQRWNVTPQIITCSRAGSLWAVMVVMVHVTLSLWCLARAWSKWVI